MPADFAGAAAGRGVGDTLMADAACRYGDESINPVALAACARAK